MNSTEPPSDTARAPEPPPSPISGDGVLLGAVLDSIGDALVVVDASWRYVLVNERAVQMLGRSREYLLATRMDLEFPDAGGWPYYRQVMTDRIPATFESYAEMAGAWVEVHAYPTLDGISLIVGDITARKRDQEALRESESRLKTVIESLPVGVTLFDADGRLIDMNAAYRAIWRADADDVPRGPEDFRALKARDPATGRQLELAEYAGAIVLATHRPVIEQLVDVERLDGTAGTNLVSAVPLHDDNGEFSGFVVVTQDVTTARESERLYLSLAEFTTAITSTFDTAEILDAVVTLGSDALGADGGLVMKLADGEWVISATSEAHRVLLNKRFRYEQLIGAKTAIEQARLFVVADADADPRISSQTVSQLGGHAFIVVPLLSAGEPLGAISYLYDTAVREFSDAQLRYAERIRLGATLALENARRYASERDASRRAAANLETTRQLLEVADSLASSMALDDVLDAACDAVLAALGRERVTIGLYDAESDALEVVASRGVDALEQSLRVPVSSLSEPAREALRSLQTVQIDYDAMTHDARGAGQSIPSHVALDIPLVFKGALMGFMAVDDPRDGRNFTSSERGIAEAIASQAATAIHNARSFEEEKARGRISAALSRLEASIHGTLDRDEVMRRVAIESAEAVGADGTVLCIRDGDEWWVRYASGMSGDLVGARFTEEQAPFMRTAAETLEVVAIPDALNDPLAVPETQRQLGVNAVMMAPLIDRGEVIGGLLLNFRDSRRFTDEEIRYAARISSSIGLAISNVRLYEAEHDIADRLQGALLTVPSTLAGIEFATAYHSAAETARVGGDFYDIFEIDERRVGIVIGDVAGKGIPAAVLTSLVKHTLRAYAIEHPESPSRIVQLTNEVVWGATTAESFATVFLGILDRADRTLTFSNAGHTSTALLRSGGSIECLSANGPIVGAMGHLGFGEDRVPIGPGDVLFLYTDGLTEARLDLIGEAEDRLFEVLASVHADTPSTMVDRVIEYVMELTACRLRDDLAVLAVRLAPAGEQP